MERFTISLEDKLATDFDQLIASRGYSSRSEAVRDLLRSELDRTRRTRAPEGDCIACLSYVFNHHERDLAERITALQHDHHDLTVATMHAHLDHDHCLETVILKGELSEVQRFTDALCAQRGVHHGHVNLIGAEAHEPHVHATAGTSHGAKPKAGHRHGPGARSHLHLKPAT